MIVTVKGADFSTCGLGRIVTTISNECKEIASHYSMLKTQEDLAVLQQFMDDLGYGLEDSIWGKLIYLYLPVFASSTEEMLYEVKSKSQKSIVNAVYEKAGNYGMKIASTYNTTKITDFDIYNAFPVIEGVKLINTNSFFMGSKLSSNIMDSGIAQCGIAESVSGAFQFNYSLNGNLTININTQTNIGISSSNPENIILIQDWTSYDEDSLTGVAKLFFDDYEKTESITNLDESIFSETIPTRVRLGVGYSLQNLDYQKNNIIYVNGFAKDLTEAECITLRNALLTLKSSLGLK